MAVVEYELRGRVAYITLNRPDKLNAIDVEMRDMLWQLLHEVNDNPDIWMAVITGNGRAFSVGHGPRFHVRTQRCAVRPGDFHRRPVCVSVGDIQADNLRDKRVLPGARRRHRAGVGYSDSIGPGAVRVAAGEARHRLGERALHAVAARAPELRAGVPVHGRYDKRGACLRAWDGEHGRAARGA